MSDGVTGRPGPGVDLGLDGHSPALSTVVDAVRRFGPTDMTVLISGEWGVGKRRVAAALHQVSPRRHRPPVQVYCGCIPASLLHSELFGHRKGTFTGALEDRVGLFEEAHQGTLILHGLAGAPQGLQTALLRFLETGAVVPIGSRDTRTVDARVIAVFDGDPADAVATGALREDLFFRLRVGEIMVPPLRSRADDVEVLSAAILEETAEELGRASSGLTPGALAALGRWRWPGNVRELWATLRRAAVAAGEAPIDEAHLGLHEQAMMGPGPYRAARDAWERGYLDQLLTSSRGNMSAAARRAERGRADLYALCRRHGIQPADYRSTKGD